MAPSATKGQGDMTARREIDEDKQLTPAEFRAALEWLDVSSKSFANLVGVNERTIRRACEDGGEGPSPILETLVCLMIATGWTTEEIFDRASKSWDHLKDQSRRIRGKA